jgi:hypothetical protein
MDRCLCRLVSGAIFVLIMLCFLQLAPQAHASRVKYPCGPPGENFEVKLDGSHHSPAGPAPGVAEVYFIQDLRSVGWWGSKIDVGVDGKWVGATKSKSWFSVSAAPGAHSFCARLRSHRIFWPPIGTADYDTQADKTYYFRITFGYDRSIGDWTIQIKQIDNKEGERLVSSYPRSVSHDTNARNLIAAIAFKQAAGPHEAVRSKGHESLLASPREGRCRCLGVCAAGFLGGVCEARQS